MINIETLRFYGTNRERYKTSQMPCESNTAVTTMNHNQIIALALKYMGSESLGSS